MEFINDHEEIFPGLYINSPASEEQNIFANVTIDKATRKMKMNLRQLQIVMKKVENSKPYLRPYLN